MTTTIYPGITPLKELFDDFGMFEEVVTPDRGSRVKYPDGFMFVGAPDCIKRTIRTVGFYKKTITYFLGGKPKRELLDRLNPLCCSGNVVSFRITPRLDMPGVGLLVATDRTMIPNIHCAFVALSDLPALPIPQE